MEAVERDFILKPQVSDLYHPLSEEQLLSHVDTALEHVSAGLYENAEYVEKEFISEFGYMKTLR